MTILSFKEAEPRLHELSITAKSPQPVELTISLAAPAFRALVLQLLPIESESRGSYLRERDGTIRLLLPATLRIKKRNIK